MQKVEGSNPFSRFSGGHASGSRTMSLGRGIWRATRLAAAGGICLVALWLVLGGFGQGANASSTRLGATTTEPKLIEALEGTGCRLMFRKVPRTKGFKVVSGEAFQGKVGIQFVAVIYEGSGEPPQPPVMRYEELSTGEYAGNVYFDTHQTAPELPGKEFELALDPAATKMAIKVDLAIKGLVAPKYRPGI
jgi:hypothetical protein